jgi:hypothetical protein
MRTIKKAIENSNINPKLIRAVVRQLGGMEGAKGSMPDIVNHGINGGFSGFIYYCDTVAFFKKNRKAIVELVEQMADELGTDPVSLVAGFNCLRNYCNDADGKREITRTLYGRLQADDTQVANALAWFAGEEVSRAFCDY